MSAYSTLKPNGYVAKCIRTLNAHKPVASSRKGHCLQCGVCCHLPSTCLFFSHVNGVAVCTIYAIRPRTCKVYPRVLKEHITEGKCGYYFEE